MSYWIKNRASVKALAVSLLLVLLSICFLAFSYVYEIKKDKLTKLEETKDVQTQELKILNESELKKWLSENNNTIIINLCYNKDGKEYVFILIKETGK